MTPPVVTLLIGHEPHKLLHNLRELSLAGLDALEMFEKMLVFEFHRVGQ